MDKQILGKIKSAKIGFIDDTPLFGLELAFSLDGGSSYISNGLDLTFNADHIATCDTVIGNIIMYMRAAKVNSIDQLVGIPVEVYIKNNAFVTFRILTEVL